MTRRKKTPKGTGIGDTRRIVRLLLRFSAGHRRTFLFAFLMLLFEALTAVGEPLPLKYLVDFLSGKQLRVPGLIPDLVSGRYGTIAVLTVGIVLLAAVNSYGDAQAEVFLAKGGRALGYNLRVALYTHLEKLSLAFHNQRRTGDVLTRVTSDVTVIEEFITESVSDLAGSLLVLTGTVALLGLKSREVMLVGVVIVPLLTLSSNGFAKRIKAAAKEQRAREGELASSAQEMLTSIGVIQTYGRGAYERQRFAGLSDKAMRVAVRAAKLEAGFSWYVAVMEALCIAGVVWLGVWLESRNRATIGDVLLYIILIQNMFKPTKRIIKEWNTIGKVYASVERIDELLDREPSVRDEPGAVEVPALAGHIEFRDVSFAYQLEPSPDGGAGWVPRLALDGVQFTITPGQMVALVGHSGAGKSTIAQLLPRLYDPHAGQVLVDGHDVREFVVTSLRGQISMVLQETVLFTGTVAENIAYGRPEASREEIEEAARKANAHEFIQRLPGGYDSSLSERAANLSGGQRQRLAIARSFIRETPILILDEPTTGLDAESTQLVLEALELLMLGKTTIVISHDLNLIRSADRILVMSGGHIVQRGTHAELLEREGLYASLYASQFGAGAGAAGGPAPASPEPAPLVDLVDEPDDGTPAPVRRKAFETALMQALPLPATPEAFRLLTGKAAPAVRKVVTVPAGGPPDGGSDGAPVGDEPVTLTAAPALAPPEPPAKAEHAPAGRVERNTLGLSLARATIDPVRSPAVRAELPGLEEALDGGAMAARIQALLADGFQVRRCALGAARYLPGAGCVLRYRVDIEGPGPGGRWEHVVGGRVLPAGAAAAAWLGERLAPLAAEAAGRTELAPFARPVAAVEPLNLVLHAFPVDAELPGLLAASDPAGMTALLGRALPEEEVAGCRVEPVTYGHGRCVLRYHLSLAGPGGPQAGPTVYGKLYGGDGLDGPGRRAAASLRAALDAAGFGAGRLHAYIDDLGLALLEAVGGRPRVPELLQARLAGQPAEPGGPTLEGDLGACARLAVAVHRAPAEPAPVRTLAGDLSALRAELLEVGRRCPTLGVQLSRWLAKTEKAGARSEPMPAATAHGHLTAEQVLFGGDRVGLLGLDGISQAEPARDLAEFMAHLRVAAHGAGSGQRGLADALAGAFLGAYAEAAGIGDGDELGARAGVYEVLSLARLALRAWESLDVDRLEDVLAVLAERHGAGPEAAV